MNNHNIYKPNPGVSINNSDTQKIKDGMERNCGFVIGRSSFPCFFTADGHNIHLEDSAKGHAIIITEDDECDFSDLSDISVFSIGSGTESSANSDFRLILDCDDKSLDNPRIIKFAPMEMASKLYNKPFVFYYIRNNEIDLQLCEESIAQSKDIPIVHTVIKICYIMGFRKFLINHFSPIDNRFNLDIEYL
jgi:hypothetical protein